MRGEGRICDEAVAPARAAKETREIAVKRLSIETRSASLASPFLDLSLPLR